MMPWDSFIYCSIIAVLLWALGALFAWRSKRRLAIVLTLLGLTVFMGFIVMLWMGLERPPLRTMGETRLWYSLFLPLAGLMVYLRWQYRWILSFSTVLATVFVCINILRPEIHSKALMPALQSPWFAPHVIVYMFSYALMGAATLMALYGLCRGSRVEQAIDDLVRVGLVFLTCGMLFGALWAKEAWGHYWSWDPKETWAAVTWLAYLVYIHYRRLPTHNRHLALISVVVAFVLLQMCWWGINYLPSTQGVSVHTYTM